MTCLNRVELTSLIAEGGHSAVYFGRNLDTFEPLAVKEVVMDANGRSVFRVELDLLKALPPHRNIPKLLGYRKTREKSYLILPYLPFPNLKTFLSQRGPLSEEDAIFVLAQMIDTVNFMMNHGVSHRDIKPDNIMVNPDNLQIKFIDFGLGKRISSVWDRTTEFIGTPLYMSPELLSRGSPFNITVSDLWSVGVVFLELLLGSNPFLMAESEQHLLRMQRELDYSQFSEKSSDLLHALLDHSTTKRMYALDLVSNGTISRENTCTSSRSGSNSPYQARRHSLQRTKTMDESISITAEILPARRDVGPRPASLARVGSAPVLA
eukprot:TRINITY_DN417_c0_g1_i2.p1 TRINITY_DN417_c0_g1~~TRINITY_DN417_c0_g1_i2.p1  ORF type:complete len:352 (-),score=71.49 TRINITY_DN417_c0_g1_i2:144-1109(-)